MRAFTLAVFALINTASAVKLCQCEPAPVCGPCAGTGGEALLSCPDLVTKGYGKISSQTKAQSKNAAKADNEYDSIQESLKYSGDEGEKEQGSNEGESCLVVKEVVTLSGNFEAQSDETFTQAAKVAESAKSATCFKRESKQTLNEFCDAATPLPLAGKSILCGCAPKQYCGC